MPRRSALPLYRHALLPPLQGSAILAAHVSLTWHGFGRGERPRIRVLVGERTPVSSVRTVLLTGMAREVLEAS
jgi:hypothetical protein